MKPTKLPLDGVKVLDLSALLPGPWCTQMLGDLGASVIKVERPPYGDPSRYNGTRYDRAVSVYYAGINGGKRVVFLDLQTPTGRTRLDSLITECEVAVSSYAPGKASKLGLAWKHVKAINPRIIYCEISGFGNKGPMAHIAGHDLLVQAMAGTIDQHTFAMPQWQAADYAAATMSTIYILAALRLPVNERIAKKFDVAMYDALVGMGNIVLEGALAAATPGIAMSPLAVWGENPRYAIYKTRDHKAVAVSLLEPRPWNRFCELICRPDLMQLDPEPAERLSTHGPLGKSYHEALKGYCSNRDRDLITRIMIKNGLPVVPVLEPKEILTNDQTVARRLVESQDGMDGSTRHVLRSGLPANGFVKRRRSLAPSIPGSISKESIRNEWKNVIIRDVR